MTNHINPFLVPYSTPHNAIPFDKITTSDYEPAIIEGMKEENKEIDNIVLNPDTPTFENTIVPYEKCGRLLDRVTTVFFNLQSAETNEELDNLAQKITPELSKHANDIMLNEKLFKRIKYVYEHCPKNLGTEETTLLEKIYESFVRNGALLNEDGKKELRKLSEDLSLLSLKFRQNLLKGTNAFFLHITNPEDLKGLPEQQCELALQAAQERGLNGWVITLQAPSYTPFITYAENRELRRKLYMAQNTKCTHSDGNCNFDIVKQLVNTRRKLAQLLGYDTYADYVLKRRMAHSVTEVNKLLNLLIEAYRPIAQKEVEDIKNFAKEQEGKDFQLEPWDFAFYAHKIKLERYHLDAEMLRPYFELSQVKKGVFGLANKLYGITFKRNYDIPAYHQDVEVYEVIDSDETFLALLYVDCYPRKSKQAGAWETDYSGQWIDEEGNHRPIASITMNLSQPTPTKPALLTLSEVETFLHEFGHSLHSIFANTRFQSLSGTNVYWDFVELPSQIMENFSVEKDFLKTFAFHYKTHESIPEELIERVQKSRNFNAAYACLRQVSFGLLDMAYYTLKEDLNTDIISFEKKAWEKAILLPQPEETCMSVQFSHIMSGGYSAGYYSYKWAEVLDADAFSLFKERGIFNHEIAQKFRDNILSRGGIEDPMILYKRFRGKEPDITALLKRDGISIPSENKSEYN